MSAVSRERGPRLKGRRLTRLVYHAYTDSLSIDLNDRPGADAQEITEGLVVDFDEEGRPVGIDNQHASRTLDLSTLETVSLPTIDVKQE